MSTPFFLPGELDIIRRNWPHGTLAGLDWWLEAVERESRWTLERLDAAAGDIRPSVAAKRYRAFVAALEKARAHWQAMGPGARRALGLQLSEDSDLARRRLNRPEELPPEPALPPRADDELAMIFHQTDEGAAQTVGDLLDLLLKAAAGRWAQAEVAALRSHPVEFADAKRDFLASVMELYWAATRVPPASYHDGPFGRIALVAVTALCRAAGEPATFNFRDDLAEAFQRARPTWE